MIEIEHRSILQQSRWRKLIASNEMIWSWISFLLILAINICILVTAETNGMPYVIYFFI